jgi:CRP-like cAMP-binding protein
MHQRVEQRYAAFLAREGNLAQRVPQKDLARYLGITPVSLSRIRRRRIVTKTETGENTLHRIRLAAR